MKADLIQQMVFTSLALAFGLLHLMLYLYSRRSQSHLYFALFAIFFGANLFFDFQSSLSPGQSAEQMLFLRLHRAFMPYNTIFALLFLYSVFDSAIPRWFWAITAALIVTGVYAVLDPINNFTYVVLVQTIVLLEAVRVLHTAFRNKIDGAWILVLGFSMMFLFSSYDALLDLNLLQPFYRIHNGYPYGFLLLIMFMSMYLARDFAKRNDRILEQERQAQALEMKQQLLEMEDARKSRELEEARQLQLSMLPECIVNIPGLDICFHMETATEVGGDYYDYQLAQDGSLTIAIGDATGHGMKAGIMVSIAKSMFIADAHHLDIPSFFRKCSETIRSMRLGNLYMAMMLVKIRNNVLTVSSAGMPPLYVYRAADHRVEEIVIRGMPLGGPLAFPYQESEIFLSPGDTVLFLSDGLPELFNDQQQMFDYPRVKELYQTIAQKSANDIVADLIHAAGNWRNGRPPDDDITFAVVKLRSTALKPQRYTDFPLPDRKYLPGRGIHPKKHPDGSHIPELPANTAAFNAESWRHSPRYLYAVDLFNWGFWWEAHEVLEDLWILTGRTTPLAVFIQGIIQLTAALLKDSQSAPAAASRLAAKALTKMRLQTGVFLGIDVAALADAAETYFAGTSALPPRIRLQNLQAPDSTFQPAL